MFASDFHHQLPRYYAMEDDPKAAGKDAFKGNWLVENNPYINPPWLLIPNCLEKVIADQAVVMLVVPKWEDAKLNGGLGIATSACVILISQKPYT